MCDKVLGERMEIFPNIVLSKKKKKHSRIKFILV